MKRPKPHSLRRTDVLFMWISIQLYRTDKQYDLLLPCPFVFERCYICRCSSFINETISNTRVILTEAGTWHKCLGHIQSGYGSRDTLYLHCRLVLTSSFCIYSLSAFVGLAKCEQSPVVMRYWNCSHFLSQKHLLVHWPFARQQGQFCSVHEPLCEQGGSVLHPNTKQYIFECDAYGNENDPQ